MLDIIDQVKMEKTAHTDALPLRHMVQNAKERGSPCNWQHRERLKEKLALGLDLKAGHWSRKGIPGRGKAQGKFWNSSN